MKIISTSKNLKIGIVLSYVYFGVSLILGLLFERYLLKTVGDVQYGLYSFATSITTWLSLLSFGMSSTYVRFAIISRKEKGESGLSKINGFFLAVFSIITTISLLVSVVICALFWSDTIYLPQYSSFERNILNWLILVSCITTSFSFIFCYFSLFETYNNKFVFLRIIDLATKILNVGLCVLAITLGSNIICVPIVSGIVSLLLFLISGFYSIKFLAMKVSKTSKDEFKKFFRTIIPFSFFVFLNIGINQINDSMGKIFLGFFATAEAVTTLTIGQTFYSYSNYLSSAISTVYAPTVNEYAINGRDEDVKILFDKVSFEQLLIQLMVAGGFLSCGKQFMAAWLGEGREMSYYIAIIFLIAYSVPYSQNLGIEVQRAYNKHKFRSIFYGVGAVLNCALMAVLVIFLPNDLKPIGIACSMAISIILTTWIGMNIYYVKSLHLHIWKYWKNYLTVLLCAIVPAGIVYLVFDVCFKGLVMNAWLLTILRGLLFVLLFGIIVSIVYHKFIVEKFGSNKLFLYFYKEQKHLQTMLKEFFMNIFRSFGSLLSIVKTLFFCCTFVFSLFGFTHFTDISAANLSLYLSEELSTSNVSSYALRGESLSFDTAEDSSYSAWKEIIVDTPKHGVYNRAFGVFKMENVVLDQYGNNVVCLDYADYNNESLKSEYFSAIDLKRFSSEYDNIGLSAYNFSGRTGGSFVSEKMASILCEKKGLEANDYKSLIGSSFVLNSGGSVFEFSVNNVVYSSDGVGPLLSSRFGENFIFTDAKQLWSSSPISAYSVFNYGNMAPYLSCTYAKSLCQKGQAFFMEKSLSDGSVIKDQKLTSFLNGYNENLINIQNPFAWISLLFAFVFCLTTVIDNHRKNRRYNLTPFLSGSLFFLSLLAIGISRFLLGSSLLFYTSFSAQVFFLILFMLAFQLVVFGIKKQIGKRK